MQQGCFLDIPDAPAARLGCTLRPEGLAAEVALEGLLAGVRAQVHVEVGFLGEGVVAELANIGPLVPASRGNAAVSSAFASCSPSGQLLLLA